MFFEASTIVGAILRVPFLIMKGLVKFFEVLFFGLKP